MRRRLAHAALLIVACAPRSGRAHPIHTTVSVVAVDRRTGTIAISIRAFADDLTDAVARAARMPLGRNVLETPDALDAYVRSRFIIDGVLLQRCGVKRTTDAYELCYRATLPQDTAGFRIQNQLLTDHHADQVNVVQVEAGRVRRTHLFTHASAPVTVVGR